MLRPGDSSAWKKPQEYRIANTLKKRTQTDDTKISTVVHVNAPELTLTKGHFEFGCIHRSQIFVVEGGHLRFPRLWRFVGCARVRNILTWKRGLFYFMFYKRYIHFRERHITLRSENDAETGLEEWQGISVSSQQKWSGCLMKTLTENCIPQNVPPTTNSQWK